MMYLLGKRELKKFIKGVVEFEMSHNLLMEEIKAKLKGEISSMFTNSTISKVKFS